MGSREKALRFFQTVLLPAYEERLGPGVWAVTPESEDDRVACRVLLDVGLVQFMGTNAFRLTDAGRRACAGQEDIAVILGLAERMPAVAQQFTIGSVGAMNTAPGGTAVGTIHGNIKVGQVDQALHKLVDHQDQLGEDAETLWGILLRLRKLELRNEATVENLEALEVRAFLEDLRPDKHEVVMKVLGTVPTLLKVAGAVVG